MPRRAQTPRTIKVIIIPSETQPPARKIYSPTFMVKIIIGHEIELYKLSTNAVYGGLRILRYAQNDKGRLRGKGEAVIAGSRFSSGWLNTI
jgi:hypothetical protein